MESDHEIEVSERGEALTQEEVQFAQLIEERERLERRHTREREEVEERLLHNVERRSVELGEMEVQVDRGDDNHPSTNDFQAMFAQLNQNINAKFSELSDRLEEVERGDRGGASRVGGGIDRRRTMVVGGENIPYHAMPKSLRDPTLTAKFNGQPREDVDQFIRLYKQQTELADPTFATARLLTCLGDVAAHAFRQHFSTHSRPADVKLTDAFVFLRQRYRKPTYQLDQLRRVLDCVQRKSAEMYFALIEEQLALVGIDPESARTDMQRLLIAIASKGLKLEVYNKLRQDSSRFKSSYTYTAFKADSIAIDNALFASVRVDAGDNPRVRRAMHLHEETDEENNDGEVSESGSLASLVDSYSDREREEVRAMLLKFDKKKRDKKGGGSGARQPAYKFPLDYKSDSICRYCKSSSHVAPLCEALYKNKNSGNAMPESLKASIATQLKSN